ncbi:ubiquitin carboxyl-terminal hydrolase 36 [Frankliniella occidentalis]|uniref:Ubiquitin carboxyl-terminal hydrolase 36 n=1 Tax=Frankliniella occidentalis TaxID=133901 RepID=A0A6J1TKB1_FRAOC|nr:ubiquitin carboxyl-terminal hydrolase 36 [Frankliniella occidentalis]
MRCRSTSIYNPTESPSTIYAHPLPQPSPVSHLLRTPLHHHTAPSTSTESTPQNLHPPSTPISLPHISRTPLHHRTAPSTSIPSPHTQAASTTAVVIPMKSPQTVIHSVAPKYLFPPELIHRGWRKKYPVGAGMKNQTNTCYLNAALQALFHVPAFVSWLLEDQELEKKKNLCLACSVADTLQKSHSLPLVVPARIYNQLPMINKFLKRSRQEDSHEFMRKLLEKMEEEFCRRFKSAMRNSKNSNTTPMNLIFGGYLLQEVTCLNCKGKSTRPLYFSDLVVDLCASVEESVWSYFKPSKVSGYTCNHCKKPQAEAQMRQLLLKAPNVLCIQLKRFNPLGAKIDVSCKTSTTLNMGNGLTYNFLAMVQHHGPRSNCGHYSTIAVAVDGSLYHFDDEQVSAVTQSCLQPPTAQPYYLFYEKTK